LHPPHQSEAATSGELEDPLPSQFVLTAPSSSGQLGEVGRQPPCLIHRQDVSGARATARWRRSLDGGGKRRLVIALSRCKGCDTGSRRLSRSWFKPKST